MVDNLVIGELNIRLLYFIMMKNKNIALESREHLENSKIFDSKIVTDIIPATKFYEAEENHQDYYKKDH